MQVTQVDRFAGEDDGENNAGSSALIAHWSQHGRWPPRYFHQPSDMDRDQVFAQPKSASSRSKRSSSTHSAALSLNTPSDQKPREQRSAEYRDPRYESLLGTKGSHMQASQLGITDASKRFCERLLAAQVELPTDSLFRDDLFAATCTKLHGQNEARVVQDISRLIVPSAEELGTRGATHLQGLAESVNAGWNNCFPVTKTRPQPDYAVGFRREAFTADQMQRLEALGADVMDQSYYMATFFMYFPFLTCEVKCGAAALNVADCQNAHSMTIALRAVVELYRLAKREQELHREILAFSFSHDDRTVRIYGHYAEIDGSKTDYYRHEIEDFSFVGSNGKEKWSAYKFTRNIYDIWMPMHFRRICSAIDQIPVNAETANAGADVNYTNSERNFTRESPIFPASGNDFSDVRFDTSNSDPLAQAVEQKIQSQATGGTESTDSSTAASNPLPTPTASVTKGGASKRPKY